MNGAPSPAPAGQRLAAIARDRHVLAALAAGPLCWAGLALVGVPLASGGTGWSVLLYGVLLSPLLEEIVFRGGLQGALLGVPALARRLGITGANVLASLAFAAAHLWSQPPLWAASVFVPSLVFGHLYERHASVVPAFLVHAFYNAGFLVLFVGGAASRGP